VPYFSLDIVHQQCRKQVNQVSFVIITVSESESLVRARISELVTDFSTSREAKMIKSSQKKKKRGLIIAELQYNDPV
jgi:hypothetical protein